MRRRVGICRALDSYRYLDLWPAFIAELGLEPVVSEPTSRSMVEAGVRLAPAELCLPAKAYIGHTLSLASKVDVLLIPRLVCRRIDGNLFFGCPKSMALPDMTRALIPDLPGTVELVIDERKQTEEESFHKLAQDLGVNSGNWKQALAKARALSRVSPGPDVLPADSELPVVGIIGHSYLVDDQELSLGLCDRVREAGAVPLIPEVRASTRLLPGFMPNWMFEKELIESTLSLVEESRADGLLLATSFACGTSAVTNEVIRRTVSRARPGYPVLSLMFDEHTGRAGLMTRLESFVDLLRLRSR